MIMPNYEQRQKIKKWDDAVSLGYIYQTAINFVRVTVRLSTVCSGGRYEITVERDGKVVDTKSNQNSINAITMADILLQIYDAGLELELLAH